MTGDIVPVETPTVESAEPKKSHLWAPGQSGNPAGRPKNSRNQLSIVKLTVESELRDQMRPKMQAIVEQMMQQALDGDRDMQKVLFAAWVGKSRSTEDEKIREPINITIGKLDQVPPIGRTYQHKLDKQE